jgi:hypothetical protein
MERWTCRTVAPLRHAGDLRLLWEVTQSRNTQPRLEVARPVGTPLQPNPGARRLQGGQKRAKCPCPALRLPLGGSVSASPRAALPAMKWALTGVESRVLRLQPLPAVSARISAALLASRRSPPKLPGGWRPVSLGARRPKRASPRLASGGRARGEDHMGGTGAIVDACSSLRSLSLSRDSKERFVNRPGVALV